MYIPERGDFLYVNFNPQKGSEQAGMRPAIVLSPLAFNKGKFIVVCPVTSQIKNYPFEVKIPDGLKVHGVILTDQLRTLDWRARGVSFIDKAPKELIEECLDKISMFLPLK